MAPNEALANRVRAGLDLTSKYLEKLFEGDDDRKRNNYSVINPAAHGCASTFTTLCASMEPIADCATLYDDANDDFKAF